MLIYDIVPPKLKDTPKKRKVLKISFWALCIGVIFSFGLAIFLFLQSTQTTTASPDPGWLTGWSYRKKITIDETKVDADLTDFPVLVKLTSANFNFTKALSTGYDIRFTSSDGITLLKYERERHDSVNSLAEYWAKVPSISSAADTDFYIYYGKSDAVDGADPTNVWDANYKGVWHMKDKTTSSIEDSTANNNDGTKKAANEPIEADGKIGKAQSFDGTNDYVNCGNATSLDLTDNFSISVWINVSVFGWLKGIVGKYHTASANSYYLRLNETSPYSNLQFGGGTNITSITSLNSSQWYYVVALRDAGTGKIYIDSVLDNSGAVSISSAPNDILAIGVDYLPSPRYWNGITDEVRISNIVRSPAWIKASYNSGNDSLVSYGEEVPNAAPTNGAGSITDMDDTDNIYAQRKWYSGSSVCSDADGFADIDYCEFRLKQGTDTRAIFRYDEDTNTFSTELGSTEWDLDTGGSSATELGNDITITWKFSPQWDAVEENDLEIELYVIDAVAASDTDTAQSDYVDVVTDLVTTFSLDDNRGNVGQSITASGTVTYSGSSLYPPDAEFTSISVLDSANNVEGTTTSIVDEVWSVTFNAPATVGTDTYNLYIDMADADYTDGEETTPTDTFITDRIEVVSVVFDDSRIDVGANAEVRYKLKYDYDDVAFDDTKGTVTGFTWDSGNSWWDKAITGSASVTSTNYDETDISFTDSTYGITAIEDDAGADIVTDRIRIDTIGVVDGRIDINSQGTFYATASLEYDNHALGTGDSLTLGGQTFTWSAGNSRFEYSDTKATVQGVTINTFTSGSEATYGITAGNINSQTGTIIWDQIQVQSYTVADSRVNINDNVNIDTLLYYDYDDSAVTDGTVTINGISSSHQGSGTWRITESKSSVQAATYDTVAASGNTYGITTVDQNSKSTTIIWDQIEVVSVSFDDSRIDVGGSAEVRYALQYDYDDVAFDNTKGTVTGFTWDGTNSWWDKSITGSSSVASTNYDETDISFTDSTYGITVIEDDAGADIVTDRIRIDTIGVVDGRIDINTQGTFYATASLEYDDHSLGAGDSLTLGGQTFTWSAGNSRFEYSDTKATVQGVTINTFTSGSEADYGITAGNINSQTGTVIYDRIQVQSYTVADSRVNIDDSVNIDTLLYYDYDDSAVTDGTVTINTISASHQGTGTWRITQSKSSVQGVTYDTVAASGNTHGITAIDQNSKSATVIWDRIEVVSVAFDDSRIDVSSSAEVRYKLQYDYDNVAFDDTKGTVTGFTWNSTNSWWDKAITGSSSVTSTNYDETDISFTDTTYGITAIEDDAGADIVTDRIRILTLSAVDATIPVRTEGTWYATAKLEYDTGGDHNLGSGDSLTLSGYSFSWDSGDNRFEATDTKNTPQTVTIDAYDSGLEATYGITAGNINSLSQSIQWQAILPTLTTDDATSVEETTATLNGTLTDDGGENCQYRFEYDTDSGEPYINNTTWTGSITTGQSFSEDITSLTKGELYYFRAQAKNSAGTGSGNELTLLTKPDQPTSLAVTAKTKDSISLSWTKGEGTQKTLIRYDISGYPADISSGTEGYNDTGTTTTINSLTNSQIYYFRAWSYVTEGGKEKYSDLYSQVLDYTNPGDASDLTISNSTSNSLDLSWTKGTGGDKTLIRRKIESYPSSREDGTQIYFNTGNSTTDSNLSPNTLYYYRAWAYNSDSGYYSDSYSQVNGRTLANVPSSLSLTADSQNQITATWQANSNPEGTEYFCENITAGTNSGWIITTSWQSTNLSAGTEYSFRVKARNGDEVSTSFTDEATQLTLSASGGAVIIPPPPPLKEIIPEKPIEVKPIFEVPEVIKKIPEIIKKIPEVLKPKTPEEIKPPEVPVEELVSKEAPLTFQGKWDLLSYLRLGLPFEKFVLAPLPKEIRTLVGKFPELEKTLSEVGITKMTELEKLKGVSLTLPGLTERVGLPTAEIQPGKFALPKGVPVAELSPEAKQELPTEIVFAKTGGELIDFNIALTLSEKGEPQQKITTISGKPLQLVVKPDKPVKSVKGYVVFKSKTPRPTSFQFPFNSLTASLIFANPVFAQPQEKPVEVEERLVLLEFEYTDPDGDGIYTAEIQAPIVEGEYEIITVMDFEDPKLGKKEIRLITVVDPEGYVYEKIKNQELRIPGAIVSLYWLNPETKQYELWPAKEYQQENPQVTDVTGKYSFLVPEGLYYLKVEAPGYPTYQGKAFEIKEGSGIHYNIELKTKYWWLKVIDWKTILLLVVILLLLYNFYRDRIRERLLRKKV